MSKIQQHVVPPSVFAYPKQPLVAIHLKLRNLSTKTNHTEYTPKLPMGMCKTQQEAKQKIKN